MSDTVQCPACGREGSGKFCAECGTPLAVAATGTTCPACGTAGEAAASFCAECGTPLTGRPTKSVRQRLPWILSALALVAFAVAISLAIGESTGVRAEGMPPTGAVIPSPGQDGGRAPDPSGVDLSSMTGREAADRLFDRAMRAEASGDTAQARFFAGMGVQAYGGLGPGDLDADARFHVGLLGLIQGNPEMAAEAADAILAATPDHLLGWILRARIAEAAGDEAGLSRAHRRLAAALPAERAIDRPGYAEHAALIAEMAGRAETAQGATPDAVP